jgi:hypothetical protein
MTGHRFRPGIVGEHGECENLTGGNGQFKTSKGTSGAVVRVPTLKKVKI